MSLSKNLQSKILSAREQIDKAYSAAANKLAEQEETKTTVGEGDILSEVSKIAGEIDNLLKSNQKEAGEKEPDSNSEEEPKEEQKNDPEGDPEGGSEGDSEGGSEDDSEGGSEDDSEKEEESPEEISPELKEAAEKIAMASVVSDILGDGANSDVSMKDAYQYMQKKANWKSRALNMGIGAVGGGAIAAGVGAFKYKDLKNKAINALIEDDKQDRKNLQGAMRYAFAKGYSMGKGGVPAAPTATANNGGA